MLKILLLTVAACFCLALVGCVIVFDLDKPQPPPEQRVERPVPDGIDWEEYERARDAGELDAYFVVEMEAKRDFERVQNACAK